MKYKFLLAAMMMQAIIFIPDYLLSQSTYTAHILQPDAIETPDICVVSVNDNSKNIVVWEKPINTAIAYFNIYRESTEQTGQWDKIGNSPYVSESVFTDPTAEPARQSYRYKISTVDTCGYETALSSPHKTMNLSILKSANNTYSLIWDEYEGFPVNSYKLYRGSSLNDLRHIASTASGNFNYNDNYSPIGAIYYQIEVISPNDCVSGSLKSTSGFGHSRSNYVSDLMSGIHSLTSNQGLLIRPNPFNDKTTIVFSNPGHLTFDFYVYDLNGKIVRQEKTTENKIDFIRNELNKGLYFIELKGDKTYKATMVISE